MRRSCQCKPDHLTSGDRQAERGAPRLIEWHDLAMGRRRLVLLIAISYLAVLLLIAIPATFLMLDRGVPLVFAVLLGLMLASIAIIALLIPVKIYLAIRMHRQRDNPD